MRAFPLLLGWLSRLSLLGLLLAGPLWGFGQNKVQYGGKDWSFIQTGHFDVYYYEGGYEQAVFTAQTADSAYNLLKLDYNWELPEGERIVIITYQSHNDFSNTNLTGSVVPESVGGFTEFYKNRVVVPFQGSWEDYRHVIHHELNHAFQLAMFYGENVLQGAIRFPLPLWFAEGCAEYTSRGGWDREANMFMADAVVSGYLPDIPYLGGFLAYKGGQSVFCYLEDEFGRERFAELMHKVRSSRSVERGMESTLGFGVEELSRQWKDYLRRLYWPEIQDRVRAGEFADRVTDHLELENFINNSPAISPDGDRMVFLSDRTGYFDLYLAHITEPQKARRLLRGQQSGKFEELHWLRPGIAWSPDGERIAFASKAGDEDELFLLDARDGSIERSWSFGLQGLFSPAFSPDGRWVAFVAQQEGQSDIWLLEVVSGQLRRLTSDRYSDFDPSFSPDGAQLLFTSDRGDDLSRSGRDGMAGKSYRTLEVYRAGLAGLLADSSAAVPLERLTRSHYAKRTPVWVRHAAEAAGPREEIFFVSDAGGAWNLYSLDAQARPDAGAPPVPERRTRMLTGVFQPSVSRQGKLLFSSFENGGYDIFLHKDIDRLERLGPMPADDHDQLPFNRLHVRRQPPRPAELLPGPAEDERWRQVDFSDLSTFGSETYERWMNRGQRKSEESTQLEARVEAPRVDAQGRYVPKPYKLHFSPDMSQASAQYDDLFGLQAVSQLVFSDLLGNHHIYCYLNFYNRIEFSNIYSYYQYSAQRLQVLGGAFRYVHYLAGEVPDRYYRDGLSGAELSLSYPLSRFTRLQLDNRFSYVQRDSVNANNYQSDQYDQPVYKAYQRGRFLTSGLSWVFDNTLWGEISPVNGWRGTADYTRGFPVKGSADAGNDFHTLTLDLRRYQRISNDVQLALRATGGLSAGETPQRFFLGGARNWINTRYFHSSDDQRNNNLRSNIEELYYAELVLPLRGAALYQREGDRYLLGNAELRFPILRYLVTGWPVTLAFQNLRGVVFTDVGGAWDHGGSWNATDSRGHLEDLLQSYGWGFRVNLGVVLLKMDWAWVTTWNGNPDGPQFVLTMGTDF
ncbi:MAG: BamA/TamA family outer membrane protein [Candidatus Delongbacteria bacterium]